MLVGDVLAYIDIFSIILLLSLVGHAAAILYIVRQAGEHVLRLVSHAHTKWLRSDSRHRRVSGARRLTRRAKNDDDGHFPIYGVAWA
jgi:hypothetical protein